MLFYRVAKLTLQQLRCKRWMWSLQKRCASMNQHSNCLISCQDLSYLLSEKHKNLSIVDSTWDLELRDYFLDHLQCRIPGAKFFDLEVCRDVESPYKMMLPSCSVFEDYVSGLGISNCDHVVIYDNHPNHALFSAPRLWWMFKVFGHDKVSVLNGGLTTWLKLGYPHLSGPHTGEECAIKDDGKFEAMFREDLVRDYSFVKNNATSSKPVQLLESRGLGTLPHSENGKVDLTASSVPCAVWSPFSKLLDPQSRSVRTAEEILDFFSANEIDLLSRPVTTCGRGVSASIVTFCAYYASGHLLPVYDGSWSEWSAKMLENE